jgi:L-malate glycosyltransferase
MSESTLKVLLISNMYAYPGNWDKLDALGRLVDLTVVVPAVWPAPEVNQVIEVPEPPPSAPWRLHRLGTYMHDKGNPFRYLYKPGDLMQVLREEEPVIVHVEQEPESLSLTQLSLLKLLYRYRLVFVAWEDHNPLRLGAPMRLINYNLADGGIMGNQVAASRARDLGYRKRMAVIPQYGFEITYRGQPRAEDGMFRVGYVGRLVEEKGVRTLAEAARNLPGTEVVMAGDGPLASELAREPHVRLLGWVPRTEMERVWSQIDVMVLPSLTMGRKWVEQFGRVIVEAMAAGVPVIGSDSGRIPDTIGDAGLVFPEGNAAALRNELEGLRTDRSRLAELTERGLDRVRRCYGHDVLMGQTVRFYEEVLRDTEG